MTDFLRLLCKLLARAGSRSEVDLDIVGRGGNWGTDSTSDDAALVRAGGLLPLYPLGGTGCQQSNAASHESRSAWLANFKCTSTTEPGDLTLI
jgi:hypothetical protein